MGAKLTKETANYNPEGYAGQSKVLVPVDTFRPNRFGLHNLHGNVQEWCLDEFDPDVYQKAKGNVDPISGPARVVEPEHVVRGGSFSSLEVECRSAKRHQYGPPTADGFRAAYYPLP